MTSPADVVSAVAPPVDDLSTLRGEVKLLADDYGNARAAHARKATDEAGYHAALMRCLETNDVLFEAIDRLAADAARYRWLRVTGCAPKPKVLVGSIYWDTSLDGIIDDAIASQANRGAPAGATAETPPKDQS